MLALPRPIGFVLGGGGSFGAGQVGMLRALAEQQVVPDLVVGTSVGSLNGAMVAADPDSAAGRLAHIWDGMTRQLVFPGGLFAQARTLQKTRTHLFPNEGLAAVVQSILGASTRFSDLRLPFAAVTTDTATSRPDVITSGELLPALLASAAIPAIFPPVAIGGRLLYDGGVVANVPMRQALDLGARSLVVLDCNFPGRLPPPPETAAEAVLYAVFVAMRTQAVLEAPIAAASVPVLYLPGAMLRRMSPLDFGHTPALIDEAYTATAAFLSALQVDGPGLYGSPTEWAVSPAASPPPSAR